jgi:RNA polymerase sigma-70 factor, ECF subfamily
LDKETFSCLAQECMGTMYRVAAAYLRSPQDRADAAQTALMKAWEKRDTLREEQYFKTWLIRILIRECINLQKAYRGSVPLENVPAPAEPPADPALRDAIDRLPTTLKVPVVLFYLEGCSIKETAKLLHLPQGTVRSRLFRARKALCRALKEDIE